MLVMGMGMGLVSAGEPLLNPSANAPSPSSGNKVILSGSVPEASSGFTPKLIVYTKKMMAVTANPYATDAAYAILQQGGNALDAAIAAQWMLNLTEPQSSGIGGGAFILYFDAKQNKLYAYDARETVPQAGTAPRFGNMPQAVAMRTGLAVGVPGLLRGLELAHQKHGHLPWAQVFAPAIKQARQGFNVSPRLHQLVKVDPSLFKNPTAFEYFYTAKG